MKPLRSRDVGLIGKALFRLSSQDYRLVFGRDVRRAS